ncbi:hypothetical protein FACS1894188_08320 [Clostridia bacterium]|nr:hypothetical protein FACS1894188_08320 [Clostridia bacterium]
MVKKILLLVSFLFLLTSCKTPEELSVSAYEQIQHNLVNMTSYQAAANVKYISNKGDNTYGVTQQCRTSGAYRVTVTSPEGVAGNVTVFDGKTISQFNPKVGDRVSVSTRELSERSEIFVTSFVKNYISSKEVSVTAANMENSVCTVLEASIPGENKYLATEKLWVDNSSFKPVKMVIYDTAGSERIVVTFTSFEYNAEIGDEVFKVS